MNSFNDIIPYPPIQRLAEIIRRQFGVHVGFISDTELIWIGTRQTISHTACQGCFRECQIDAYRSWFKRLSTPAADSMFMECPRGMRGIAVPIFIGTQCIAAFFASGFRFEYDASEENAPTGVPVISAHDSRILTDLIMEMTHIFLELPQIYDAVCPLPPDNPWHHDFSSIAAVSPCMKDILKTLDAACDCPSPILIEGAPGTGKETLARTIHQSSIRRNGPFVALSCTALNEALLDSELFGHKRGAFVNALTDKPGLLDVAHQGTFFLDDVDALPPALQDKLLQLIQEGTISAIGESSPHVLDVRIIAATARDLRALTDAESFRHDLYYRLSTTHIKLPSLAMRRDDIIPIARDILKKICRRNHRELKSFSPETLQIFYQYDWPGNISEMEREIERLIILSPQTTEITPDLISQRITRTQAMKQDIIQAVSQSGSTDDLQSMFQLHPGQTLPSALEDIERRMIGIALEQNDGNRTKTAEILGISRRNLIRKIETLNIDH
ncbi:MAG: sigma-54-dependent Fis family transcriptional regulator [Proteobacteria bacterium]|nr:sigma-54-dependent Fis family transcriptional regulator [Pseudomonadota bacterium]